MAGEEAQVQLVDDARRVHLARDHVGDRVVLVLDRLGERRTVHEVERLAQRHAARPLALARALARRATEQLEESVARRHARVEQLLGARAAPRARHALLVTGGLVQRIEQGLGWQPPRVRMRVVQRVVLVPAVGLERALIGLRAADEAHQLARVEAALHERARELIEQLRVGGRVARADVVDRLDQAHAEEVAPDPVHVALREVGVVLAREPRREPRAARAVRGHRAGVLVRERRRHHRAAVGMLHVAVRLVEHALLERLRLVVRPVVVRCGMIGEPATFSRPTCAKKPASCQC
jgi:hypothetical protein